MKKRYIAGLALAAAALSGFAHAQGTWKPERNVEILTGTAAGGALDKVARLIQSVWQNHKLVAVPATVVNKVGGGGAVSWAYMNQKPGDGHYLSVTSVVLMTNKITGANPITYTDLTPIVHLSDDYQALTVPADSPFKTGRDLIEKLKADPTSVRFGLGTSLGGSSHIGITMVAKAAGVDVKKLRFAVFKSGGASALAALGGHVDVVASSAANYVQFIESGKMRSLGAAAPKRLGGPFANVPTWREQGIDAVFSNWRGIAGPKGLTPAQIAYWESVMAQTVKAPEWKQALERTLSVDNFMPHAQTMKFLAAEYKEMHALLSELGLAKQP